MARLYPRLVRVAARRIGLAGCLNCSAAIDTSRSGNRSPDGCPTCTAHVIAGIIDGPPCSPSPAAKLTSSGHCRATAASALGQFFGGAKGLSAALLTKLTTGYLTKILTDQVSTFRKLPPPSWMTCSVHHVDASSRWAGVGSCSFPSMYWVRFTRLGDDQVANLRFPW